MPSLTFDQIPDTARLWTFVTSRSLSEDEGAQLLQVVDAFLAEWAAHGVALTTARDWRYDQFLFVAVDEAAAGVSGCSVDALVGCLRGVERELDISLTDHGPVMYRDDGAVRRTSRDGFRDLARAGAVGPTTVVFDNTIQTVAALREGRWELPARESWHADLLRDSAGGR